jgi:hypothetical protein
MVKQAKNSYYSDRVKESADDQKALFGLVKDLLHKNATPSWPKHDSVVELAERFSNFFMDKIEKIRASLTDTPSSHEHHVDRLATDVPKLTAFDLATEEEVRKIIMDSKSNSCLLDPIPTSLLKDNLDAVLPIITAMVNMSMEQGLVPPNMKLALVIPLLKKILLDPEILKNFRPVSNLSFVSKITEKVVGVRLNKHVIDNNLDELFQSAYRQFHSTETALLRVQNDILRAADKQQVCALVLLDLSAAFDTVDHTILLSRLSSDFGISGTPLSWVESYLTDRYQQVIINGSMSNLNELKCGVPQGSVLGPLLFVRYCQPIANIIRKYGINFHFYADDTQLYIYFDVKDTEVAMERLEKCIAEISAWMKENMLQLNDGKTEFLIMGSKIQLGKLNAPILHMGEFEIKPTTSARNIGAYFDDKVTMKKQITETCRAANYHIHNIWKIRNVLTDEATEKLVHSFVSNKLDYCNSLLSGVSESELSKLQRVQNSAARVVTRTAKYNHIKPVLQKLHWLPVRYRINFKILLLTFKASIGKAPKYICDMLEWYEPTRTLRSTTQNMLKVPHTKLKTFGDRAFSRCAPKLWNKLPIEIKNSSTVECFKTALKTHFFSEAYK